MFIDAFSALLINLGASIREYFEKRSKQSVQQRELASLSYYHGVTLVGRVTSISSSGVMISFMLSSQNFECFAPFSEFRIKELSGSVKVGTRLNFAMEFGNCGEIFLRVSGENQCQSEQDWPIMI